MLGRGVGGVCMCVGAWDGGDCAGLVRGRGITHCWIGMSSTWVSYIAVTTLHTYVEKMGF